MDAEEFVEYSNAKKLDYNVADATWAEKVVSKFRVAKKPFALGALRAAHHAYLDNNDVLLVAKRFLKETAADEETYRLDVAQQMTAHAIGIAYNA
jgi:hypothetical protein